MDGKPISRSTVLEETYLPGVALYGFKRYDKHTDMKETNMLGLNKNSKAIICCQPWRVPSEEATALGNRKK